MTPELKAAVMDVIYGYSFHIMAMRIWYKDAVEKGKEFPLAEAFLSTAEKDIATLKRLL